MLRWNKCRDAVEAVMTDSHWLIVEIGSSGSAFAIAAARPFCSPVFFTPFDSDSTIAEKSTSIHNRTGDADRGRLPPRSADRGDPCVTSHHASRSQTTPHQPPRSRPAHPGCRPAARLRARRQAGRAADRLALQCFAHAGAGGAAPADRSGRGAAGSRRPAIGWPSIWRRRPRLPPNCRAPRKTIWPRRSCATVRRAGWTRR